MANSNISPPDVQGIISPLLSALPAAAMSPEPAPETLQLLTPILRQKVEVLKSGEPWIGLLQSTATADKTRLSAIARSSSLEPHPVSGEIEVDWDHDVQVRFRRLDPETLRCLAVLKDLNLFFRLDYCTGGEGGNGWKVGEVGVAVKPDGSLCELDRFCGYHSVSIAEKEFGDEAKRSAAPQPQNGIVAAGHVENGGGDDDNDDDNDDDDYWARYDATPARTPATKRSPAPRSIQQTGSTPGNVDPAAEAAYFSQYDSVQPAMDNHDPDEEAAHAQASAPSRGYETFATKPANGIHAPVAVPPLGMAANDTAQASDGANTGSTEDANSRNSSHSSQSSAPLYEQAEADSDEAARHAALLHPRPASVASSQRSGSVAKLELAAENFGVKQHISRTIKSLFQLSRASGIDQDEFATLVKRELDVLGMMAEDDY